MFDCPLKGTKIHSFPSLEARHIYCFHVFDTIELSEWKGYDILYLNFTLFNFKNKYINHLVSCLLTGEGLPVAAQRNLAPVEFENRI